MVAHTSSFVPLHDRVLIQRVESDIKTKGGVIIPETATEKPAKGVVIAVGRGAIKEDGTRGEMDVKLGDVVVFGKYNGVEIKVKDKTLLVMREKDIIGIERDE